MGWCSCRPSCSVIIWPEQCWPKTDSDGIGSRVWDQSVAILQLASGYASVRLRCRVVVLAGQTVPHRTPKMAPGIESTSSSVYCHKQGGHVTFLALPKVPPPVTPDDCTALALHLATVCIIPGHLESHLILDPPVRLWSLCRDAVLRRDGV